MNKKEYLEDQVVIDFMTWLEPRISGDEAFIHSYYNSRDKSIWKCDSIYNAYENYKWRFSCSLPNKGKVRGDSYKESEETLLYIQQGLRESFQNKDSSKLLAYCLAILEWGGVTRSNYSKLEKMGSAIVSYFEEATTKLDPLNVDSNDDLSSIIMNSGFTKIYSLLIDDFVIYDSRVGAALGLLVKQFLIEKEITSIPSTLNFAYGNARPTKYDAGKANRRNPSDINYKFPVLTNNDLKHTNNNLYANWLLKAVSEKSIFSQEAGPIRALESALFMIGYSVRVE